MVLSGEIDFKSLFESAPGLFLIMGPDLTIVTANEAYLSATMTKLEDIRGRTMFEVFPDNPDDPAATGQINLRASLDNVLQHGKTHTMAVQQYDIRRPDGTFEQRYWSPVNKPIFSADGSLRYIIHRAEDVSSFMQLKKQQERQRQQTAGLQQQMIEMQAEVYNRAQEIQQINHRLVEEGKQRAKAEAAVIEKTLQVERANKELETFAYSVSHDLRAPLRIIDGYTEIAIADYGKNMDAEGQRILNIIASNVKRMGQLIDDLLNLSRTARKDLDTYPVNMQELVTAIVQEQLGNNGKYTVQQKQLAPAVCDRNLIYQVWTNLISNAIKYSSSREHPVIEISSVKNDTNEIVYTISDNGVGFNMKYADKLFGVFQRLHKMTEFEGTGVGLALVQQIVTRHGGRIWADAVKDKGATFSFTLPVVN